MEQEPFNKVAASGLLTLDLEKYLPGADFARFDIGDYLFQGLILREKEFRAALQDIVWQDYAGKIVLIFCSADAIIPMWAYMLVAAYATPHARDVFQGDREAYLKMYFERVIGSWDAASFVGQRVVVKGCSDREVPASAYATAVRFLQPLVRSIFFGEPCSTVPIYKKPST